MKPFDVSFRHRVRPGQVWARHGEPWTEAEHVNLRFQFQSGADLETLCLLMGRSPDSIVPKLVKLGLLTLNLGSYFYNLPTNTEQTMTSPNTNTNAPAIETKTLIAGADAATLDDHQIFKEIYKLEQRKSQLDAIQHKPKKLVAAIEQIEADILAMVEYVDSRE